MTSAAFDPRIWLADLTYTQQTVAADVMPNAIGGIATFTESRTGLSHPVRLFKYPEKLVEALKHEEAPNIIGFSNYVWNFALSYGFARVIKELHPRTIIIFGGPNYPTDQSEQEEFLRRHDNIDFYIIKEGELAFSRIVEGLVASGGDVDAVQQKNIPSVHSAPPGREACLSQKTERISDLSEIPSPYILGKLDEFFDGTLLPIVQTNRGCPFSCTFCVEGVTYYNKVYANSQQKIDSELEFIGQRMHALQESGGRNDLFIADSNFGMYRQDLDTCRTLSSTQEKYGWPEYINVATGKNKKERVLEASTILGGALRLSGSVQSLDKEVLGHIKRANISAQGLMDLALDASKVGANTYSEIILGLPGDTVEKHIQTIKTVIDAGFTNIFLFQLMLLPGTELATPEAITKYGMQIKHRVLPRCYGHFDIAGKQLIAAEIESICVANNTLSFDDYLYCRKLHLVVTMFYNDSVFGTLPKLLRLLGIPVFAWIESLFRQKPSQALERVFDSFIDSTQQELWDSREELEKFIQEPGVVDQLIAGELGNNLLFVHKTLAITHHIRDLADLAQRAIEDCLCGFLDQDVLEKTSAFVEDAILYHVLRVENIFSNTYEEIDAELRFNIPEFENSSDGEEIGVFELTVPQDFAFCLDNEQRALIERYIGIYGDSPVGIGRILSKVYVRKLFRTCSMSGNADQQGAKKGVPSSTNFQISGLQN
ncbi:MAG: cobalamin-dependent protein [Nitrospinaceae bacterium]|jgi:radical SAM superfamily enzyme YgiQ (UPF0313 family)|nr:cobalamin-dependent protein [Nitrospinaceae bacterium]|tara:strand:+ start:220 stop:2355 length:2136 start_codon:yes stop_codon:yes gene_type:complete